MIGRSAVAAKPWNCDLCADRCLPRNRPLEICRDFRNSTGGKRGYADMTLTGR
jgi:hypothetical protein